MTLCVSGKSMFCGVLCRNAYFSRAKHYMLLSPSDNVYRKITGFLRIPCCWLLPTTSTSLILSTWLL